MSGQVTFIKLGGSIITNKEVPMMVREEALNRLVKEIVLAKKETGDIYVIGHGAGSFAHVPAQNYRTMDGFVQHDSRIGMAITQDSAAQLNRIVVRAFLAQEIPAVTFACSNTVITNKRKAVTWCYEVLEEYLAKELVPITFGDVIVDQAQGCTIWSTEEVLSFLVREFLKAKKPVSKIVHVTEVDGVLNEAGKVIPEIFSNQEDGIKKIIGQTKGFDVTGGMWHKLKQSFQISDLGVPSYIVSGLKENNLYNTLVGQPFVGTVIH
jgi:isopentenyl phosphate kinase